MSAPPDNNGAELPLIPADSGDILIPRKDVLALQAKLLASVHALRELAGLPPLVTGSQDRKQGR